MDWLQLSSSLVAIVLLALVAGKMFPVPSGLTADRIRKNYMRYAPESAPGNPIISINKQVSILPMADSSSEIGLVTQLGDRVVCRTLTKATEISWETKNDTLIVNHGDFTQPSVKLNLPPEMLHQAVALLSKHTAQNKRNSDAA
ncbi:MAG: hypothetical protein AB3N28_09330 [Kordiimonas sp.]